MYGKDEKVEKCKEMILSFFKEKEFAKGTVEVLELLIDIYCDIIYTEPNRQAGKEKLLKALYSLQNSNSLDSFLKEDCVEVFDSFLKDFLNIGQELDHYYIGNESFAQLDLYELQNVLIQTKHHQLFSLE